MRAILAESMRIDEALNRTDDDLPVWPDYKSTDMRTLEAVASRNTNRRK